MKQKQLPSTPTILVTIDYELFGNGSGSIDTHILNPTWLMLDFFAQKKIKATFFVEVGEIIAFKNAINKNPNLHLLKHQYTEIENQLQTIIQQGHDVQLHYHPQWLGATLLNGVWQLPSSHGSLLQHGEESLKEVLLNGKYLLESICKPIHSDYKCIIFRAGMLHYDRSNRIGEILGSVGLRADSSVARGYVRKTNFAEIDYSDLLNVRVPYWLTKDGTPLLSNTKENLLEIPIWASQEPGWTKLNFSRLFTKLIRNRTAVPISEVYERAGVSYSIRGLINWLLKPQASLFDFTLLSGSQLINSFKQSIQFHAQSSPHLPVVMIGHTKELINLKGLEQFHRYVSNFPTITWDTVSNASKTILGE